MGSQAKPATGSPRLGAPGAGPPELVLGVAETLRHEVDGLVGLVLVGLQGGRVGVEGPDLRLLGEGVLRGPQSQDLGAPPSLGG